MVKMTMKKLSEWHRGKLRMANGSNGWGEAQICKQGVDLRGTFNDGMWILTLSWEEVAALARKRGLRYNLSGISEAMKGSLRR
jgi:hypothetical protein